MFQVSRFVNGTEKIFLNKVTYRHAFSICMQKTINERKGLNDLDMFADPSP